MPLTYPASLGKIIDFLGYEVVGPDGSDADQVIVATYWRITQPSDRPLSFFVHLLDRGGGIIAQHDGLSAPASSWQTGDILIQLHPLTIPPETPEASNWLQLGLYDTETLERFVFSGGPIGDQRRVLLPLR